MRFLLDANLSPRVAAGLRDAGFDAVHVADIGLLTAADDQIFDRAADDELCLVTADADFAMLLALRQSVAPSVVLLRGVADQTPDVHLALLTANLPTVLADVATGAVVSLSPSRLAVRRLPIS